MPTYDYACAECGHTFELFQRMSDRVRRKCPKCGRPRLRRLVGPGAGVIFKGSGFYQTDYRSESYKKAAEAESKKSSPDKSDKAGAKDKPAAKDGGSTSAGGAKGKDD